MLLVIAALSLYHSGAYAEYLFWESLSRGELVHSQLGLTNPLVLSRLEVAWTALVTPEPGQSSGLRVFRFLVPGGLVLAVLASLSGRRESKGPG